MTRARRQIISTADTPYYHCIARCVRRAFLCGHDPYTQRSYEHRRQWVIDRLFKLQQVFCIDICAYAVMSNHYHLVLCINEERAAAMTTDEVINAWCRLYKGPVLIQRYRQGSALDKAEYIAVSAIAEQWRSRLADISWFMRSLNEHIARQANQEDSCRGHFWESRFKSQALLDEKALLTCMAYVDLNPIRATLAETPETSDYTSVQNRIAERRKSTCKTSVAQQERPINLLLKPFDPTTQTLACIGYDLHDYLELVDVTGRAIRDDKRGFIAEVVPPILERLNINPDAWLDAMTSKGIHMATVLGGAACIADYTQAHHRRFITGASRLKRLLP
ncbi:transposase [Amphritea sp. 1_MG-2023]|uniref:transposase n=1 Tax=Amphritea sp. 1_MG-2023 TaxID=3062670 RepID=UPI0026E2109F|nr:transposase [Amphritea sp. 1_MG-2023]MDO6564971.1 transposase [Amphritea sp. 1_MG-2023]